METNLDQLIDRGKRAFEQRDYVSALANFQEVIERNPRYPDIRHLTGLCLSFVGQTEDALREFEAAVALNDSYVEAHLNRAITLNELGRYDDAREAFARATDLEQGRSEKFPAAVSAKLAATTSAGCPRIAGKKRLVMRGSSFTVLASGKRQYISSLRRTISWVAASRGSMRSCSSPPELTCATRTVEVRSPLAWT